MKKEGNADYGGMMQPSQQHVAPCVKGDERHERFENSSSVFSKWYDGEACGISIGQLLCPRIFPHN